MKPTFVLVFTIGVTALSVQGIAARQHSASQKTSTHRTAAKASAKANLPAPVAVEVLAVDPQAKTITVRDIAAVPAPPGKAVEITLPVPAAATGQKLSDVQVGQRVAVTCTVKPTVHPTAGVPIVLTDCARVIKIEPSN
jgi:hypothetical protein